MASATHFFAVEFRRLIFVLVPFPMLGIHDYGLFVATGVLLNLTPGQDTFFVLGRSIAQGRRVGVASALGIGAGALAHSAAAALGLSAVLATSASAFLLVKLVGAVYLIYLGVRMLTTRATPLEATGGAEHSGAWAAFRQGVLSNVLNPKVALFFLALMPQFVSPNSSEKVAAFALLGLTFVTTGTLWCIVLALAAARMRAFFRDRPGVLTGVYRAAGLLFVLLGVRLAVSER